LIVERTDFLAVPVTDMERSDGNRLMPHRRRAARD
jgi:hypothetical protein